MKLFLISIYIDKWSRCRQITAYFWQSVLWPLKIVMVREQSLSESGDVREKSIELACHVSLTMTPLILCRAVLQCLFSTPVSRSGAGPLKARGPGHWPLVPHLKSGPAGVKTYNLE